MNKKQMEEKIKQLEYELLAYRRPVGHSVINVRLEAKKEVFDDIEKWVEKRGLTDLEKCNCNDCYEFRELKKRHLISERL